MKQPYVRMFLLFVFALAFVYGAEEECNKDQRLVVTGCVPGGAAERAGIQPGDVIVSYNGNPVHCLNKLTEYRNAVTTDSVALVIERAGKTMSYTVPKGMIGVYLKELLPDLQFDESSAVVIENIGRLGWDRDEENSFMGALARIAEYLGIKKDYTYLMGASGAAFRILFHEGWCPSSPDPTCGYDCGAVACRVLNVEPTYLHLDTEQNSNKEEILQAIQKSIDAKMPVLAIDLIEVAEWGLVVGYRKYSEMLFVRTYFDKRDGYDVAEKFPWVAMTLIKKEGDTDDRTNFKNALAIAQELYETEKYGAYYSGIAALEYWIKRLQEEKFDSLEDTKFNEVMHANWWIWERFAHDRMQGAIYLKAYASLFSGATEQITKLAALYENVYALIDDAEMIVPGPEQGAKREDWKQDMRNEQIEVLKEILSNEKQSYTLIQEINKKLGT